MKSTKFVQVLTPCDGSGFLSCCSVAEHWPRADPVRSIPSFNVDVHRYRAVDSECHDCVLPLGPPQNPVCKLPQYASVPLVPSMLWPAVRPRGPVSNSIMWLLLGPRPTASVLMKLLISWPRPSSGFERVSAHVPTGPSLQDSWHLWHRC